MPVAFIGLSSFLSTRKILKKTAVELMKGDEQKAKVNFIERALRLERFKFNTKFQIREQVRSLLSAGRERRVDDIAVWFYLQLLNGCGDEPGNAGEIRVSPGV
jgi:hypothetical protein